jgi:hypothetical protein
MASPVKTVSTATATQVVVAAKKKSISKAEFERIEWVVKSCRFLGVESVAVCRSLSKHTLSITSSLLKNSEALRVRYAEGFFRVLWIDYFNQGPTDYEIIMYEARISAMVRAPVPKIASFDQLMEMNGRLDFFDPASLGGAEIPYETGEFARRYKLFEEFSSCLTELVVNDCLGDEFFKLMRGFVEACKDQSKPFKAIDKVFSRWNELHPPNIIDEPQASPIPGTSEFVAVKVPDSCCVIPIISANAFCNPS